jgi:hypothetical protein
MKGLPYTTKEHKNNQCLGQDSDLSPAEFKSESLLEPPYFLTCSWREESRLVTDLETEDLLPRLQGSFVSWLEVVEIS